MILVKFPTRSRPKRFLEYLSLYITNQTTSNVHYLISLDHDDDTVTDEFIDQIAKVCKDCTICVDMSNGKIHACNRDMDEIKFDWQIVVLASDDMKPVVKGWDKIISDAMLEHFPDLDGVLYFSDGYTALNTMCIMGRKYYKRFDYIYNPEYISLWCDNEFQEVSRILGKEKKFDQCLFKHEHPVNVGGVGHDLLYNKNEKYYLKDKETFDRRKAANFGL